MGEESRSPRRNTFPLGALHSLPPPITGEHPHLHPHPPFIDTFLEMEQQGKVGSNKGKKKKEQAPLPQRKEETIQYSSVQVNLLLHKKNLLCETFCGARDQEWILLPIF
jgi:hypothetical protein